MTIFLRDIWPIAEAEAYKLHFARWNGKNQPLEVWARDWDEWQGWQEYRPARNDFNRPYIFALIQFYHETDSWLFGGVFRVLNRFPDRYEVELTGQGASFLGRLKIRSNYRQRSTRVNFENHFPNLELQEILREPYSGRAFPGFEDIDLSFEELEALVRNDRLDWKAALESVKGHHCIADRFAKAWLSRGGRTGTSRVPRLTSASRINHSGWYCSPNPRTAWRASSSAVCAQIARHAR